MPSKPAPIRVLVVDDERIVADSLVLILRGRGFDALTAYSAEDAAALASSWNPQVVISDVIMGKMDGVALAIHLAQTLPLCRVLLMSGNNATGQLVDESKKLGYDFPLLAKPFGPEEIFPFLRPSSSAGTA